MPSFKRGTVTQLFKHWRTTAGFAPAGLQGSEVVLNTFGPLQSKRFPPHFKTKTWEVREFSSGPSSIKVLHECLWGVLVRGHRGVRMEGSPGTVQLHPSALLQ